ncbi:hypothetical protein DMH18_26675 [Streptomyces sp. WAC 06783]|uniref:hypothetical protein n=1 Tax=Streptomyces sp. WAC 06783 TaxID=2203211 RepID=UPI000F7488E1|nr:hypothetical protein [Streptomyces sp. WAC 06783]RSO07022.1 hypothetical protein DMH18_26675 [Streptomyces sp. WAC 06783]
MALRFIGIDPETGGGNCPAVWVDEAKREIIVQGWHADETTLQECAQNSPRPADEGVVRIPARMTAQLREACDVADRARLR